MKVRVSLKQWCPRRQRRPARPVDQTRARLQDLRRGHHLFIAGTRYTVADHLLYADVHADYVPLIHRFTLSNHTGHARDTLYFDEGHDMAWFEVAPIDPITEAGDTLSVAGGTYCLENRTERIVSSHGSLASFRRVSLCCYRFSGAPTPGQYLMLWLERYVQADWHGILAIEIPLANISL